MKKIAVLTTILFSFFINKTIYSEELQTSSQQNQQYSNNDKDHIIIEGNLHSITSEGNDYKKYESPHITEQNQNVLGNSINNNINRNSTNFFYSDDTTLPRHDFIDIASYQGYISIADYKNMKAQGIKGVVVKLTESTSYVNPYAKSQIQNAKSVGLKVSAYHYSWFGNKSTAEAEALFFANTAKEHGLDSSTVMVNDAEQFQINNGRLTENSMYFTSKLNSLGFNNVIHYSMENWFSTGIINIDKLGGNKNIWKAQYPYSPSKYNLLHQNYAAWQWNSSFKFIGDSNPNRLFDINIDYGGRFSYKNQSSPGEYIADGRYVTITKNNYTIWANFDWKYKDSSNNYLNQTLQAKGRYEHSNGSTYYSLYDKDGVWKGYINSSAVTVANGDQGAYIADGRYATIIKKDYNIWSNFDWKKKSNSNLHINKTYQIRGRYQHFNGSTFYSMYDNSGSWQGYINANATIVGNNPQGAYIADGRYVTITKNNYNIWANFDWKKKSNSNSHINKTYQIRGRYQHFNGSTFYSIYNNQGIWEGYINSQATTVGNGPQGAYLSDNKQITIKRPNYNIWNNFNWDKKANSNQYLNTKFIAKVKYSHFNGSTYYSLYDNNNNWYGYVNSNVSK